MTHPAPPSSDTVDDTVNANDTATDIGSFVSVSHVTVDVGGETGESAAQVLERAFTHRLGEVEGENGFQRLEVWRDVKVAGTYVMVTWWDTEEDFRAYLRSEAHDRSHARVPTSPARPRGAGLDRYQVVAR